MWDAGDVESPMDHCRPQTLRRVGGHSTAVSSEEQHSKLETDHLVYFLGVDH